MLERRHLGPLFLGSYGKRAWASRRALLSGFVVVLWVLSCAHAAKNTEVSEGISGLSQDQRVQRELRDLRGRYFALPRDLRRQLTPDLEGLIARYPSDPATAWARCYLALNYIDGRKVEKGRQLAQGVHGSAKGRLRDLAAVALASALTSLGSPGKALVLLAPLSGKVIEAEERQLFYEEVTRAAVAAKSYQEALQAAYEWVTRGSLSMPEWSQVQVQTLVQAVPTPELQGALSRLKQSLVGGRLESSEAKARAWFLKTLRQTLMRRAIETKDHALSRWILSATTARERTSEATTELSRLATTGEPSKVRVIGRRLGLILSSRTRHTRDRSASVLAGILGTLDLSSEATASIQLKTESEDGSEGGILRALEGLVSEGVALVIAGIDVESAHLVAAYAESQKLPVLLLEATASAPVSEFVFRLGVESKAASAKLNEAIATVVPGALPAVFLLGDAAHTEGLLPGLLGQKPRPRLLLGLESAELLEQLQGFSRVALSAGKFPGSVGQAPWFQVLGRDAALLSAQALLAVPPATSVEDRKQASRLHALAGKALAQVEAELWSTETRGFGGSRDIPRTLTLLHREPRGTSTSEKVPPRPVRKGSKDAPE